MENGIWTIFHKTGRYSASYVPVWQRYVCYGGMAEPVKQAGGDGKGKNRLTLRIRDHFARLLDADGNAVSVGEAALSPGDLIAAGEAAQPDGIACWRVNAVAAETGGGLVNGIVLTAE